MALTPVLLILPGEELADFEELIKVHLETWKPTNLIEDILVTEMATTLWRLRRQAPAEASLIDIQIQRMTCNELEFTSLNAHGAYGIAVAGLQSHSDALSQIARQGRRLLSLYQQLRQEILTNRELFPPTTPGPIDLHPQSDPKPQMQPTENTTMDGQEPGTQPVDKIPVETKLNVAAENHVIDPHSLLYAVLPPIFQPRSTEKPLTAVATT